MWRAPGDRGEKGRGLHVMSHKVRIATGPGEKGGGDTMALLSHCPEGVFSLSLSFYYLPVGVCVGGLGGGVGWGRG